LAAAHGLQGFFAAQGLQGFAAAQGLHGLATIFLMAQGLHGFAAAQGLHGFAAQGLQGAQADRAGLDAITTVTAAAVMPVVTANASGTTVVASKLVLNGYIRSSRFLLPDPPASGFGMARRA